MVVKHTQTKKPYLQPDFCVLVSIFDELKKNFHKSRVFIFSTVINSNTFEHQSNHG